jgi:glutamine amidotransferase
LIDYDSGNLHSAQKRFERMAAAETDAGAIVVTGDPTISSQRRIECCGDGAFPHCHAELRAFRAG